MKDERSRRTAVERHAMGRRLVATAAVAALIAASVADGASGDRKRPDPDVAGVQTALVTQHLYRGPIDGILGPQTLAALKVLQQRARFASANVLGNRTLSALGKLGRPRYGTRTLRRGLVGLDVAGLQFELRYHGFPTRGTGVFDARTFAALVGFQRFAGLRADGIAGRGTFASLDRPPPVTPNLRSPLPLVQHATRVGNAVELACPYATAVAAVAAGTVVFTGNRPHGYGYTVITRDARGLDVLYAHLARIDVRKGQSVIPGAFVGLAGWTGKTRANTSLRLELRLRGAELNAYAAVR
jgi:murein DD-endopeptidase MepM/ murein hydrolase activator NlpD